MSDLYSAQLTVNTKRYAICNAHQLRDLQYAIDAGDTVFAPAVQQVDQLKHTANWLNQLDVPHPDVRRLQKRFRKQFKELCYTLYIDK